MTICKLFEANQILHTIPNYFLHQTIQENNDYYPLLLLYFINNVNPLHNLFHFSNTIILSLPKLKHYQPLTFNLSRVKPGGWRVAITTRDFFGRRKRSLRGCDGSRRGWRWRFKVESGWLGWPCRCWPGTGILWCSGISVGILTLCILSLRLLWVPESLCHRENFQDSIFGWLPAFITMQSRLLSDTPTHLVNKITPKNWRFC